MSIKRQFGSGVAWMAAGNWIEQAVNFSVFVLLARLLGAEAFGLLAMAAAFVILSEFLVRESLSEYLIAHETPQPGHFNAAFWLLFGLGTILAALLVGLSGYVASFYDQPIVQVLMKALSPTVLLIALTAVPVAILRRDLKFRSLSLRAIAGVAAGGVVAIWMALNGYGVWSLAGQRLVQVFTNVVMAWAAVSWRPGFQATGQDYKDVLGFGSKVLGLRAAELARTQVPTVIIGATLGPVVLGFFSIAWRLVEIASFLIVTPLRMVSQPAFAAMTRDGQNAAVLLADISRLSGLIAFPAFFGLAVLSEPVLALLFGAKWLDAAPILSVLAFIGVYLSIEKVHQSFCLAAGRAGAVTTVAWIEVALGATMIWAVSGMGVTAMSMAYVASFLVLWFVRFRIVSCIASVTATSLVSIHVVPFVAATVMGGGIYWALCAIGDPSTITQIAVGLSVGALVFCGFTLFFMSDRIALLQSYVASPDKIPDKNV